MHNFEQAKLYKIQYVSKDGKVTERVIVPSVEYSKILPAIDVSDVPSEEQQKLLILLSEYNEYRDNALKTIFSFKDWMDHSYNKTVEEQTGISEIKFRKFDLNNIKTPEKL